MLTFLFSFHGTADRRAALMVWLAGVIAAIGMTVLAQVAPMQQRYFFPLFAMSTIMMLAVSARRLHHAGHSGRWAVAVLIPLLGLIAGLIIALLPQKRTRIFANSGWRVAGYIGMIGLMLMGVMRVWWSPYSIPSESMKPTLLVGDYVLMRAQAGASVQRGDVVVLRRPKDGDVMVKRVIGLGGDVIALQGGQVWLNGAPLVQLSMGTFSEVMGPQGAAGMRPRCTNGLVGDGGICEKTLLREVLADGRSYLTADLGSAGAGEDFPQTSIPEGMIFVLGDNRDNSLDSRFDMGVGGLGLVATSDVFGVMRRVLFSSAGSSMLAVWTWRGARFWEKVV